MRDRSSPPGGVAVAGDDDAPRLGTTRATFLRRGALAAGAAAGAGAAALGTPGPATPAPAPGRSPEQDRRILNFALMLERLQVAFYAQGRERLQLRGELRQYVDTVHPHEVAHAKRLASALGGAADPEPRFGLDDATADLDAFLSAAVALEDAVVGGYYGQAPNLTPDALRAAAPIVSVEARHASWIRDFAGELPAPHGTEPLLTAEEVRTRLRDAGLEVTPP